MASFEGRTNNPEDTVKHPQLPETDGYSQETEKHKCCPWESYGIKFDVTHEKDGKTQLMRLNKAFAIAAQDYQSRLAYYIRQLYAVRCFKYIADIKQNSEIGMRLPKEFEVPTPEFASEDSSSNFGQLQLAVSPKPMSHEELKTMELKLLNDPVFDYHVYGTEEVKHMNRTQIHKMVWNFLSSKAYKQGEKYLAGTEVQPFNFKEDGRKIRYLLMSGGLNKQNKQSVEEVQLDAGKEIDDQNDFFVEMENPNNEPNEWNLQQNLQLPVWENVFPCAKGRETEMFNLELLKLVSNFDVAFAVEGLKKLTRQIYGYITFNDIVHRSAPVCVKRALKEILFSDETFLPELRSDEQVFKLLKEFLEIKGKAGTWIHFKSHMELLIEAGISEDQIGKTIDEMYQWMA